MRLPAVLTQDFKFQFRHGFYWAYLIVLAFYILILINLPAGVFTTKAAVFILFSDTTVLGFFFVGGIILLEKNQNILESLFVTPLKLSEYLLSKIISLTLLSYLASIIIAVTAGGLGKSLTDFLIFSIGVILTSLFFMGVGIAIVSRVQTVNDYFFKATVYTFILFIPLLDFFNIYRSKASYLFPTHASLIIFKTAFTRVSWGDKLYSISYLALAAFLLLYLGKAQFEKNVISKIGAEK